MNIETVLSTRGQMIIPKKIRELMGLHTGSKLLLKLVNNNLQVVPLKNDISKFFGMGKRIGEKTMSITDIDDCIIKAVVNNDRT
jgi:AbrB family looped-hinge helix DNA binding protein